MALIPLADMIPFTSIVTRQTGKPLSTVQQRVEIYINVNSIQSISVDPDDSNRTIIQLAFTPVVVESDISTVLSQITV